MNLYIIKAWNKNGGCIGEYYVVANGVNKAKYTLRENNPVIAKVEVQAQRSVIISK